MDPNENLREQRALTAKFRQQDRDGIVYSLDDLGRMADLAEALDTWISGGGFLPDDWARDSVEQADKDITVLDPDAWEACEECGARIPVAESTGVNQFHDPACSLHPENAAPEAPRDCLICHGLGAIEDPADSSGPAVACPACAGTGHVYGPQGGEEG